MPSTPHTITVEAVVLRHSDWGEADRLLVIYTRQAGKLRAVAKGARRMRSRKAGHLEPFTHVRLFLAHGRDFWIVTQAETIDAYMGLGDDLLRTGYAAYLLELIDRFTYDDGDTPGLFSLLVESLARVEVLPDPFIAVRFYELRLLDMVGFRPELFHCVRCGNAIRAEDQFFDALQGGVICPACSGHTPTARPVTREALRFIRHMQRSSFNEAVRADPPQSIRSEMEGLLNYYLTYLLERKLNSPHFLDEIRRSRPQEPPAT